MPPDPLTIYVEMPTRVLSATLSRGQRLPNGTYCQRLTVHVESGPDVPEAEARAVLRHVLRAIRKTGVRVIRWGFGEEPNDE